MAFSYYRSLTVQSSQVPSTQTNFPVLVSVTHADLKSTGNGGHVQSASGYDIRPYSDSNLTSALTFELEFYDPVNGILIMWVKISSLSDGVVFYLAYGNAAISSDGTSSSTWDTHFKLVADLDEASNGTRVDSTSNANDLADVNGSIPQATGKIHKAANFNNGVTTQYLRKTSASVGSFSAFTLSFWFSPNSNNGGLEANPLFGLYASGVVQVILFQDVSHGTPYGTGVFIAPNQPNISWSFIPTVGTFYKVDVTWNGSTAEVFVNGASMNSAGNAASATASIDSIEFGQYAGAFYSALVLDNPRISDIKRSNDWLTTEYNNQNAPGSFLSIGGEIAVTVSIAGKSYAKLQAVNRASTY